MVGRMFKEDLEDKEQVFCGYHIMASEVFLLSVVGRNKWINWQGKGETNPLCRESQSLIRL